MKKIVIIVLIVISIALSGAVIILDYYKPIFVNDNANKEWGSESLDENLIPVKAKPEKTTAKICISGDNLIHENVIKLANRNKGGSGDLEDYELGFDFNPMYEQVAKMIENADYTIINQASIVGASKNVETISGYPLFHSPESLADDLIELGVDGVNIANNHMLDKKESGYKNSVVFWKTKDIDLIGGFSNTDEMEDIQNKIVTISDIRIAMLSYTATTNGITAGRQCPIPYFTVNETAILKKTLTDDVKAAKELSDLVFVFMNWGNCAGYEPDETQVATAQILADAGADVIIGTGPKVIQKIEEIKSSADNHTTICAYSLGNFMGTMEYMENLLGGILSFDITKKNDQTSIQNVIFTPTVIHYNNDYSEISVYPLNEYTEKKYLEHGSNFAKGFGSYQWFNDTVNKIIPQKFHSVV